MRAALTKAAEILVPWCDSHPGSYPPTILHVTDGQSTDGNPEEISNGLRQISTGDGPCLMFNLHVSMASGSEVVFPASEEELPDEYSRLLFRMSSPLPPHLVTAAEEKGYTIKEGAKGCIVNASAEFIVAFFEIGTRPKALSDR